MLPALSLTGCKDDELLTKEPTENGEEEQMFPDGFSLCFNVTLDPLGGIGTRADDDNRLYEIENYIDPEKFRVLFFDDEDKFLFESKSRWITQIDDHNGNKRWRVSVPVFTFGNEEDWNWDFIYEKLTTKKFKIAALVNRPEIMPFPDVVDNNYGDNIRPDFDNRGPFWTVENADPDKPELRKRLFDLHHCQYDPIFESKGGFINGSPVNGDTNWYDFICNIVPGEYDSGTGDGEKVYRDAAPWMGSVCNWVDDDFNYFRQPEEFYERPIPMYGVQQFDPITNWKEGTTFNISQVMGSQPGNYDYKPISLLRSAVKLELRIPSESLPNGVSFDDIDYVAFYYGNVYSRCEPMDVWTPTNEIWKEDHALDCEWRNIYNYGPLVQNGNSDGKASFQKALSWFYGSWLEQGWDFGNVQMAPPIYPYPRVFNQLTQRKKKVFIKDSSDNRNNYDLTSSGYHRWTVYIGERNINDPTTLGLMNLSNTNGYYAFFEFRLNSDKYDNQCFFIPMCDYSDENSLIRKGQYLKGCKNAVDIDASTNPLCIDITSQYEKAIVKGDSPLPLLRNHLYRFTISTDKLEELNVISVNSEVRNTPDIDDRTAPIIQFK